MTAPENPPKLWAYVAPTVDYDGESDDDETTVYAFAVDGHASQARDVAASYIDDRVSPVQAYVREDVAEQRVSDLTQERNLKVGLLKGERKALRDNYEALRREHEALQVRHAALLSLAHMTMNVAAKGRDALPDLKGLCVLADAAIVNDGDAALAAKGTGA